MSSLRSFRQLLDTFTLCGQVTGSWTDSGLSSCSRAQQLRVGTEPQPGRICSRVAAAVAVAAAATVAAAGRDPAHLQLVCTRHLVTSQQTQFQWSLTLLLMLSV